MSRHDEENERGIEQSEVFWTGAAFGPPTDVIVTEDSVLVRVELAGVGPQDVRVQATSEDLIVSGLRREPPGPRPQQIARMEIAFGPFERRIPLPAAVEPGGGHAILESGLLEIVLPLARSSRVPRGTILTIVVLRER